MVEMPMGVTGGPVRDLTTHILIIFWIIPIAYYLLTMGLQIWWGWNEDE